MQRRTEAVLLLSVLVALAVVWFCLFDTSRVQASRSSLYDVAGESRSLDLRLRAFILGAEGNLSVKPTATGGRVHLRVRNLPRPQALAPMARTYVVWATASGSGALNLGELRIDKHGNGQLKFDTPTALAHYSLIVTAEANAAARSPLGTPVLATRGGEVSALFVEKKVKASARAVAFAPERKENAKKEKSETSTRRRTVVKDFFGEIEEALNAGASRTLSLTGGEAAPNARGQARVATRNNSTYVWMRVANLPASTATGANTLVLWAVAPDGRVAYLGSLPPSGLNTGDTYVRASGINFEKFDLAVTSERTRPVARPAGRRVLVTSDKAVTTPTRRHHRRFRFRLHRRHRTRRAMA
jgi:hypothetical protein